MRRPPRPARASRGPGGNSARLRQGLELGKHPKSLCRRLAPFSPAGRAATACPALPPDPQVIGLYIAACASGASTGRKPSSVATIERRLSALTWHFAQRGEPLDRADRHIATVLAGIRRKHGRPPEQKEAVLPDDLLAMLATLDLGDLRGLRDRAILLDRLRRRPAPLGNRRPRLPAAKTA